LHRVRLAGPGHSDLDGPGLVQKSEQLRVDGA
jgi:hypothetical protein